MQHGVAARPPAGGQRAGTWPPPPRGDLPSWPAFGWRLAAFRHWRRPPRGRGRAAGRWEGCRRLLALAPRPLTVGVERQLTVVMAPQLTTLCSVTAAGREGGTTDGSGSLENRDQMSAQQTSGHPAGRAGTCAPHNLPKPLPPVQSRRQVSHANACQYVVTKRRACSVHFTLLAAGRPDSAPPAPLSTQCACRGRGSKTRATGWDSAPRP